LKPHATEVLASCRPRFHSSVW